jgi:hypothetical protein
MSEKLNIQTFAKTVVENGKYEPSDYDEWYSQVGYPSLQNIRDGYFGENQKDFKVILEKFAYIEKRRR